MDQRNGDEPADTLTSSAPMNEVHEMDDLDLRSDPANADELHLENTASETDALAPQPLLEDQTNFLPARQVITVFLGLSVTLACSQLDATIIATALPRISSDLHSGSLSAWVATAYLLTSLAFTPLYGRWSNIFGRRLMLMVALAVFFVFSLACALSRTMKELIIFRAFQGIGGGAIQTMVFIIVSDIGTLKERGKYQGINEAVVTASNGIGPLRGGAFAQYSTWRWAFWINLPLSAIAIRVALWLFPLKSVRGSMRSKLMKVDYPGSVLTIASSISIIGALNWGGVTFPWKSVQVVVPLLMGVGLLGVFVVWEGKYARLPIMPLHIFRNQTVTGIYLLTLMSGMTFLSTVYYVPQFLQLVRGTSPVVSSVLLLPFLVPTASCVFIAGQIVARTGHYRWSIILGFAVWTVPQGLQSTTDEYTALEKVCGLFLMGGISSGFTFQTSLLAAQAAVPRHEMAVVRNFVRVFGSTISLAICASLINNELWLAIRPLGLTDDVVELLVNDPASIRDPLRLALTAYQQAAVIQGYTKGFRRVFYVTAVCCTVACLSAFFLVEQLELNRADDGDLKRQAIEELRRGKGGGMHGGEDVEMGVRDTPEKVAVDDEGQTLDLALRVRLSFKAPLVYSGIQTSKRATPPTHSVNCDRNADTDD